MFHKSAHKIACLTILAFWQLPNVLAGEPRTPIPQVATELKTKAGIIYVVLTFKNVSELTLRIPENLDNNLNWLAWYAQDGGNSFSVEPIRGAKEYGTESHGKKIKDLYLALTDGSAPTFAIESGREARFEFPINKVVDALNITQREGSDILIQAQISNALVGGSSVPSMISERLFRTKLYSKRLILKSGQWSIFGAAP